MDELDIGNTDNGNLEIWEPFTKSMYFINNDLYVIFDWNEWEISEVLLKEELEGRAREYLNDDLTVIYYGGSSIRVNFSDGEKENYKLVPNETNGIELVTF